MVKYIQFMDILRQEEIEKFYKIALKPMTGVKISINPTTLITMFAKKNIVSKQFFSDIGEKACQMHREYYKGYPKSYHPLTYFKDAEYMYQCPPDISPTYLSFPPFHIKYKQPVILPHNTGRTSGMPQLPDRCLAGRYNKPPCKLFIR